MTTNWGNRSTPENRAGTQLTICVHMLMMQFQRVLVPRSAFESAFDPVLDAMLYAYALRQSVQVAEMCRAFDPDRIGRAITEFGQAVPDYRTVRNVLAHFDEYEIGSGRVADVKAALTNSVHFVEYDPDTQIMTIGGRTLDIKEAYGAANKLLITIRDVLTPAAFPEPPPVQQ